MPDLTITDISHQMVTAHVQAGDIVIDATTGNGHDTVFLAGLVGKHGKVYGFDVQQEALDQTWKLLEQNNVQKQVCLFHAGHELMPTMIPEHEHLQISAIMFNLGYLPGGDKTRTTQTATSLHALECGLQLLKPGGIISIIAYPGHTEGQEESKAILHRINHLNPGAFKTEVIYSDSQNELAPILILARKTYLSDDRSSATTTNGNFHLT